MCLTFPANRHSYCTVSSWWLEIIPNPQQLFLFSHPPGYLSSISWPSAVCHHSHDHQLSVFFLTSHNHQPCWSLFSLTAVCQKSRGYTSIETPLSHNGYQVSFFVLAVNISASSHSHSWSILTCHSPFITLAWVSLIIRAALNIFTLVFSTFCS